jgi:hypothetical protein
LAAKLHVGFHFPGSSRSRLLAVVAKINLSRMEENVEWCTGRCCCKLQIKYHGPLLPLKILIWFKGPLLLPHHPCSKWARTHVLVVVAPHSPASTALACGFLGKMCILGKLQNFIHNYTLPRFHILHCMRKKSTRAILVLSFRRMYATVFHVSCHYFSTTTTLLMHQDDIKYTGSTSTRC